MALKVSYGNRKAAHYRRPMEKPAELDPATQFRELYEREYRSVYRTVRAMVFDSSLAEDLCQECFVRAFRSRDKYKPTGPPGAWLHRIAVNAARNRVRDRGPAHAEITEAMAVAAPAAERPDAVAERAVGLHRLREHLGRLPRAQREAVVLRHVQDLAYDDVATALQRPVGTVKSDVHRGLARLRAGLGDEESDDG